MANTTTSPNMNLPVPVVAVDPGPDWANNVNACLGAIDSHNHSTGQGVQINPAGININADLPMNQNNLTTTRTVRFTSQSAPLSTSGTSDVDCVYVVGKELYYNDGAGNQVPITNNGSVNAGAGSITGLPSGTASVSYAAGTYTFNSATNTPANMLVGPVTIGSNTASPKTTTIQSSASQASNLTLTLPLVAGAANQVLQSDGSSNLQWSFGLIPLGSVLATFPNLTGAYTTSATTTADANGFVLCAGQTISDATSPMNGQVIPNINNSVFLAGNTTAGTTGGAATSNAILAHTHGAGTFATSLGVTGTFASSTHSHNMSHYHQWGHTGIPSAAYHLYTLNSASAAATIVTNANYQFTNTVTVNSGSASDVLSSASSVQDFYTTGSLGNQHGSDGSTAGTGDPSATASVSVTGSNSVTGTSASGGSGSSFSILPPYITAVYLMRIK